MKIVHLSDVHVWRYTWDVRRLAGMRALGVIELLTGRARRFQLDRLEAVVDRVLGLAPDHVLITGDLTTTCAPFGIPRGQAPAGAALDGSGPSFDRSGQP